MEARIPFLSTALPTDLEPSRAKTECTARLQRPFTPRSPLQTDRVKTSFSPLVPGWPLPQIGISMGSPRAPHISIPTRWFGLSLLDVDKERQKATGPSLGQLPISFGPQRCPGVMGWFKREEMELGKETEWTERGRYRWGHKANMQHRPLHPTWPPSLPFHNRGPATALPKVWSMKACFLPFSTIGPFSASCFCSDRGVLPLSCVDRPAKSCCGLLVQRGHVNTGSKNTLTNWHPIVWNVQAVLWQNPSEMLHFSRYNPWTLDRNTEPAGLSLLSHSCIKFSVARSRMCLAAIWPLCGTTAVMLWLFVSNVPPANVIVFQGLR